jgi:hypothetical protein
MIQDEYLGALKPASRGGDLRSEKCDFGSSKSEFEEGSNPKCGEIIWFIWIDERETEANKGFERYL